MDLNKISKTELLAKCEENGIKKCKSKNKEVNLIDEIRFFFELGFDVNSKTEGGWNALHILCQNYKNENLIDIVQLFIEKGVDINLKDRYGSTSLNDAEDV